MKKLSILFLMTSVTLLAASGCKSELDDKKPVDVKNPGLITLNTAGLKEVTVDKTKSKLRWVGSKVTGDEKGTFKKWDAKVYFDKDQLKAIKVDIDVTSLEADGKPKLTGHLKSPDFFDVVKYPHASFVSNDIKSAAGGHTITGNLTLRGVTKQISFPIKLKKEGGNYVATAEFTIKRFDFNIVYKGKADDLINDKVLLKFHLVAPAPK